MKIKFLTENLSCVDLHPLHRIFWDSGHSEDCLLPSHAEHVHVLRLDTLSFLGDFLDYSMSPPIMRRRQAHKVQDGEVIKMVI